MNDNLLGLSFPFRINGRVELAAGEEKIKRNLRHLLLTRVGERLMRRVYGGGVHRHLREPDNTLLRGLVKYEIEEALRGFLPEVELTAPIRVAASAERLLISVEYRIRTHGETGLLELSLP